MRAGLGLLVQAWAIALLIVGAYGFIVGWTAATAGLLAVLLIVAACHAAAAAFGGRAGGFSEHRVMLHSRKEVRELGPDELEEFLDEMSPGERRTFANQLRKVDPRMYLDKLPPGQRDRFESLLRRVESEQDDA
ncbi:MAG: hypothetical protein WD069_04675 [Planctomycetales bacterium]